MTKLKLSAIPGDKPVELTMKFPEDVNRDLIDCARVLGNQTDQELEPARLIAQCPGVSWPRIAGLRKHARP